MSGPWRRAYGCMLLRAPSTELWPPPHTHAGYVLNLSLEELQKATRAQLGNGSAAPISITGVRAAAEGSSAPGRLEYTGGQAC